MIAAPWYLLAAGCVTLVIGAILVAATRPPPAFIHADMRDDQIADELERGERSFMGVWVLRAGALMILISVVWRLTRFFA